MNNQAHETNEQPAHKDYEYPYKRIALLTGAASAWSAGEAVLYNSDKLARDMFIGAAVLGGIGVVQNLRMGMDKRRSEDGLNS